MKKTIELFEKALNETIKAWFIERMNEKDDWGDLLNKMVKDDVLVVHKHESGKDGMIGGDGREYICLVDKPDADCNPGCHFFSMPKEEFCKIALIFMDRYGWKM